MEILAHAVTVLPRALLDLLPGPTAFACLSPATLLRAQPDPSDLLLRVRDRVLNTVDRLPRYLCTQTVDRWQYEPGGIRAMPGCKAMERERGKQSPMVLTTADRLRLDVGVAQGKEASRGWGRTGSATGRSSRSSRKAHSPPAIFADFWGWYPSRQCRLFICGREGRRRAEADGIPVRSAARPEPL